MEIKESRSSRLSILDEAVEKMEKELKFPKEDAIMLVYEFVDSIHDAIEDIDQMLKEQNMEGLSKAAHMLKGLSSNMRVVPLFECMKELEQLAKLNQLSECEDKIHEARELNIRLIEEKTM